jgi:hypothetical protein
MFPALKKNLVRQRFLDDGEVETVATWWFITWNAGFVKVKYESSYHDVMNNLISGGSNADSNSRSVKYELLLLQM